MTDTTDSDVVIVAQLKTLNKTWSTADSTNHKDGPATADTGTAIDAVPNIGTSNKKHQLRHQIKQTVTRTALEQARIAISKLRPATSSSSVETTTTIDSIVPYLFSVLSEKDDRTKEIVDETNVSSNSQILLPGTSKDVNNEYNLRQIEWHIVLILELLSCATQSNSDGGFPSTSTVLNALAVSILLFREQSRLKDKNGKKKRKKKRKKDKNIPKDPIASAAALSYKEKETLFFDHLIQILSRAPFFLPRGIPLSEFLINRILSRESLFWERLHRVVSHIFETFEIPNPYLPKSKDDKNNDSTVDRSVMLSSAVDNKMDDSAQYSLPGGKNKYSDETITTKKRKSSREKLQAIAKNKKRQRLASITSKKKHRGSHFHRNLDDISKLLDKKKTKTTVPSNTGGKMAIANSDSDTVAALKVRKANDNNSKINSRHDNSEKSGQSIKMRVDGQKNNKSYVYNSDSSRGDGEIEIEVKRGEVIQSRGGSKTYSRPEEYYQPTATEVPKTNPFGAILERKRKNSTHDTNNNSRSDGSRKIEALPTTPRKNVQSDTTLVIGETPVPNGVGARLEDVVGETPVAGSDSRKLVTIVGETPTYENSVGATPMLSSLEHPFSSPPVLPSPTKWPTASSAKETTMNPNQPVKLFGTVKLLKRTNSIGSRGKMKSWDGSVRKRAVNDAAVKAPPAAENKSGGKRKVGGLSSIDKARAFLRSKCL